MPCYHPLAAWEAQVRNDSGRRSLVFNVRDGDVSRPVSIPCGRCLGCRLEKARQWSVRCVHEAKQHEASCFVTLTYSDDNVPVLPCGLQTLRPRDMVLFLKRLRKRLDVPVRFFQCGEYGEKTFRPHHHVLLFGYAFPDRKLRGRSHAGEPQFESAELDDVWGYGRAVIGELTSASASYVARYTMKKVVGPDAEGYYQGRVAPYLTMSRRPGIGRGYLDLHGAEVLAHDSVVVDGREVKPPKFYDSWMENACAARFSEIKKERMAAAVRADEGPRRLLERGAVKEAVISNLKRML